MSNIEKQLQEINSRLNTLRHYQNSMQEEIKKLEQKLLQLQSLIHPEPATVPIQQKPVTMVPVITAPVYQKPISLNEQIRSKPLVPENTRLENFIGTNLISKIGILITIIGVFIGARYAIDRDLISPSTRIIFSYIFAALLAFTGLKLKEKYNAFSAVLMGGSIAIVYFSTYIGHGYYNLIPQLAAFATMFITTLLAVGLALWYDQKIIALIGQVAAYAIPILLSDGSGKAAVMFTYITIINAGLMVLSFRKNWKIIYRIAFAITWSIYFGWIQFETNSKLSWGWVLFFISLCFISFYTTYLSYKIFKKELYNITEVSVLLLNAVLYYFLGYVLIDRQFEGTNVLTVFTLANAGVHFATGYFIHRLKLADESVRLFLFGQALTFITIAIPVKLDGSWVTLLWSIEAAILIYTAAKSERKLYYQLCGIIMIITLVSLVQDWSETYNIHRYTTTPYLNQTFLTSLFTAGCFLFACIKSRTARLPFSEVSRLRTIFISWIPVIFIIILYLGIFHEINMFYDQLHTSNPHPLRINFLGISMLFCYTLLFITAAITTNTTFVKSEQLFYFLVIASLLTLALQITSGFYALAGLRNTSNMWVRYLNITGIALLWWSILTAKKQFNRNTWDRILLSVAFNITLLAIISNEYINWVKLSGSSSEYNLGLTLIFGAYALVILFIGLLKNIRYLRIEAIVLFAVTIIKLFLYDLRSVGTIGKTIVLIILGVILLAASFLYNKYVKKNTAGEN